MCDDVVTVTRDSSGVLFAEQGPVQSTDHYLEIPPMPLTAEQEQDGSDLDGSDNNEDDGKSVDVFFEDISSSLIDIRKDRTSSSSQYGSIISNPLNNI